MGAASGAVAAAPGRVVLFHTELDHHIAKHLQGQLGTLAQLGHVGGFVLGSQIAQFLLFTDAAQR